MARSNSEDDIFDSKVLFNDVNNRFQYYKRVFTHKSVNKYLIVKNINTNVEERLLYQDQSRVANQAVAVSDIWCSQHNNFNIGTIQNEIYDSNIVEYQKSPNPTQSKNKTDVGEPKRQNIQIVPVDSLKQEVALKDYIPGTGRPEVIASDDSSEFNDDFSVAESIIMRDKWQTNDSHLDSDHAYNDENEFWPVDAASKTKKSIEQTIKHLKQNAQNI